MGAEFVVGLTGGIGSGKSAVSTLFERLGVTIVDADLIAREVVAPGSVALTEITSHFGTGITLSDGSLDRAQLRERVFGSPTELKALEGIVHPRIREQMRIQTAAAQSPYVIQVTPLLLESSRPRHVDRVLVVDVAVETQISRTMSRDSSSRELVERIVANQVTREERLAQADDVIDNSAGPAKYKRDENGLIESVQHVFNEDGSVNWRAMIPKEHLRN